jgi:LPPG:FO 2-phospho-L-lactate transferase
MDRPYVAAATLDRMRVTVLAGGIGGARFLRGLTTLGHDVTVVGNVGDDITLFGLRICPDLDTVMYTLGGGISADRGWGREDESFRVGGELAAYAEALSAETDVEVGPRWFGLGDLDLATHVVRTMWLRSGVPLSEVTRRLCARWQPGVTLLPATDDAAETRVALADGRDVHFQEWWVGLHAAIPARSIALTGGAAAAGPGVVDAVAGADVVLLPPSNPVVSIGAILAIPAIAAALRATPAPVVGLSPIVGDAPVRGMADACLAAIGVQTSAYAVARHYGSRAGGGLIDGWLVDETDKVAADRLVDDGLPALAVPLMMTDLEATAEMARAALALAEQVRR